MTKDPRVYLAQILERIERIESYTSGGEAAFVDDPMVQDAVNGSWAEAASVKDQPTFWLIRLPDVPAAERVRLIGMVLERHEADLWAGSIITLRRGRIRVSRPPRTRSPITPESPPP